VVDEGIVCAALCAATREVINLQLVKRAPFSLVRCDVHQIEERCRHSTPEGRLVVVVVVVSNSYCTRKIKMETHG
jgi:hypothetical protein